MGIDYECITVEYLVYLDGVRLDGPCDEQRARQLVDGWPGRDVSVRYRKRRTSLTYWSSPSDPARILGADQ